MTATLTRPVAALPVAAVLLAVFVARPLWTGTRPLVVLFVTLLLIGVAWPTRAFLDDAVAPRDALLILGVGVAVFAMGRLLGGGRPPLPSHSRYVAEVVLAAVAEEAFFRRFVYAALRGGGAVVAVGGSALLFATAHVTVYGWWVFPLDLAAGLLLSWQRWTSGRWTVPAVTHVVANLLILL